MTLPAIGQQRKYSTFYEQRSTLFEALPITEQDIIFLGNSITNGGEWSELLGDSRVKNRGISGDIAQGVLDRLAPIVSGRPRKIFLLIGTNDIAMNIPNDTIECYIRKIVERIRTEAPGTKLYLQSVLPVNPDLGMFQGHMKPDRIADLNERMRGFADGESVRYVDLYSGFIVPGTDKMDPRYTNDGLHLLGDGYLLWRDLLLPYLRE